MALDHTQIINKPMITEKTSWESTDPRRRRYSFLVHIKATKPEIKAAIEHIYGVRVESVTTQIRKGQEVRTRHGVSQTSTWKKAAVKLHAEDKIELF